MTPAPARRGTLCPKQLLKDADNLGAACKRATTLRALYRRSARPRLPRFECTPGPLRAEADGEDDMAAGPVVIIPF